ncbi:hypothetical protein [Novosphingobium sp. ST904]|uniref:hypothetical protein n=1 Tax=Novosphingobium sp. ST904 TaxID=1684385 RepID=UPI00104E0027|nr:hypothetical protein [Novosphingobium sp. ST904]
MAVNAAPSVFVKKEPNSMWWDGAMNARILGQAAGPVTVKKLSDFIGETMIYYSYTVCSLEPVGPDTFGGIDRDTQTEIDGYKAQSSWRAESVAPGGRRILGQSVVFEGCDDGPRGAALLVTDTMTGEILRWQPMGNYTDNAGREVPIWVMFLDPKQGEELFSTSLCRECGDRTHIYYDITRKHVYAEHNGH